MVRLHLGQRGDTILEVLISLAVLSLILASTFVLASRSTAATRSAAERGEASKLASAQMELLKIYLSNGGEEIPSGNSAFCLDVDNLGQFNIYRFTAIPNSNPDLDTVFSQYPAECQNTNGLYNHYIERAAGGTGNNSYTSVVRWIAPSGDHVNQASLIHKMYPNSIGIGLDTP